MANVNKPTGLLPVGHLLGLEWSGKAREYYIASNDGSAYAIGDPVVLAGSADTNGVPSVTLATAGATHPLLGAIVGWGVKEGLMADPSNLDTTIIPATKTKGYYVMVSDDPYIIYEIQEYGVSGTSYAATDIGANANLKAGTNNGYVSGWTLDNTASAAADATYQVQLLGLSRRSDNAFGQYGKLLCRLNLHQFNAAVVGV